MTDTQKAYEEKMRAQIDELDAKIELLRSKARSASADAQAEFSKRANEMEAKAGAVRAQLKELVNASEEKWQEMKAGVEDAYNQFKKELDEATK
ncbi:MAG: coiled coil domain-containing protein [candidate division Zixibacteria bacterium]|nr:coiled coil domain-containing protein [candidate division Zixibacteria bacterium]